MQQQQLIDQNVCGSKSVKELGAVLIDVDRYLQALKMCVGNI
jgi:hypothetical protein